MLLALRSAQRVGVNALRLLALAFLLAPALRAETTVNLPSTTGSGVTVRLSTPLTQMPHFGFLPVRVFVENLTAKDGTWDLNFQVGGRGVASAISNSPYSVSAPAGQTRETWLYVPVAQSGFAINAGSGGPAGRGAVTVTKIPTGTRVTREMGPPSSSTSNTMITDINETTGERTMTTTLKVGGVVRSSSTNTSTVPPGSDVTYTIDPSGNVSSSTRRSGTTGGPTKVTVVNAIGGSRGGGGGPATTAAASLAASRAATLSAARATAIPSASSFPKITITTTPTGTKMKREYPAVGGVGMIEESDFDTKSGLLTVTRTMPEGSVNAQPPRQLGATAAGFETTITIDPATGGYNTQSRQTAGSTAPAKFTVVVRSSAASSVTSAGGSIAPLNLSLAGSPGAGRVVTAGAGGITYTAGPGSSWSAVPVIPPGNAAAVPVTVDISGPGFAGNPRVVLPNNSGGNTMRPFAISASLEANFRVVISGEVRGAPNLSAIAIAQLPADWRLWSSFAGVVLTADEYVGLDAARRGALRGWAGMGGQLYLVPTVAGEARTENVGAGRIVTLAAPLVELGISDLRAALNIYTETPALPDRETLFLKKSVLGDELEKAGGDNSWVAVFLIVFAAVIGPVNLFVFAPRVKRHRLFWTTPALALAGGIILIATIFLQDGIGGAGLRSTVVVLLPGQNQAAVFQEQAGRTGFLTKRTFALEDDVVFAPLTVEAEMNIFAANTVSRAAGQATGDWFQSRSRPAQLLRRLAPTRGRVELVGSAANGAPIVESSLATELHVFTFRDEAGKFWGTSKLNPGTRVTLDALAPEVAKFSFSGTQGSRGLTLVYDAATKSTGACWTARGGETEVAPVGTLSSMKWTDNVVSYVGVAEMRATAAGKGALQ